MRVDKLALNGFRNYEWESVDFAPGTNVISGENAQGKTNLLEAVYLLATGRSFRTRFDRELVNFAFSEAELLAEIFSHERQQTVRIRFHPGTAKKIQVNGVRKTATELSELLNGQPGNLGAMLTLLSICSFYYGDLENGYVKNIAGQVPQRGYTVLSKFLASIPHGLLFFAVSVLGKLLGTLILQRIEVDAGVPDKQEDVDD